MYYDPDNMIYIMGCCFGIVGLLVLRGIARGLFGMVRGIFGTKTSTRGVAPRYVSTNDYDD